MKTLLATLAVAAVVPIAAFATTVLPGSTSAIAAGDSFDSSFTLGGNANATFDFTTSTPVKISDIATSGTGHSNGADLSTVLFGIGTATTPFASIISNGSVASAAGLLNGFVTSAPFTLAFDTGATANDVGLTFSFDVLPVSSAVPVPAAGVLLLSAFGFGGGLARWKRRRST